MFLDGLKHRPCYGGLDLAAVNDLTAFVLVWPIGDRYFTYPWFWIPSDGLRERSHRHNVRYDLWVKDGYVETTPGNVTDWCFVRARIKQLASIFDIRDIGFDPNGARDTATDLKDAGIEVSNVEQSMPSLSAPSKRLEGLVLSQRLVHTGHPVLRWNVDCCTVAQDAAGNIKPVKPKRMKTSKRIDGVVALIMAISRAMVADSSISVYADPATVVI